MVAENTELAPVVNDFADTMEKFMLDNDKRLGTRFAEDDPVDNYFAPGLYARALFRKAGTLIVGHAHRHCDMAILLHGRLRVVVDGKVKEIVGPSRPFVTEAGTRKVTFALEDSTLITFHPTPLTDIEEIEEEIFIKSPAFLDYETFRRLTEPEWNRAGKFKEITA